MSGFINCGANAACVKTSKISHAKAEEKLLMDA